MIRNTEVHKSLFLGPLRLAAYVLLIGCLFVGLSFSSTAHAGTIPLSSNVSEQVDPNGVPLPDPIDAADLDATLDFVISGTSLELTVTNQTSGDELFDINEVYFNATSNVTGLTYISATHSVGGDVTGGWSSNVDDQADGFGIHDFAMIDGVGANNPNHIRPTQSILFELTISGTGPFAMSDFTTELSRGSNSPMLAVAKFVNRRDSSGVETLPNDSAFGATPEPATLLLAALGLLGLPLRRR